MDWSRFGNVEFTWGFFFSFLSIILIDLMLAGDNALVIAMAVRTLPRSQRLKGSAFGAGAAVFLRVALTFVAAQLLLIKLVKFVDCRETVHRRLPGRERRSGSTGTNALASDLDYCGRRYHHVHR